MAKTKSTKRALLMSALALLLCVSMLIGSTYAWFTDSVTSAGNIIKSGTLDVTMEWLDGKVAPADDADWIDASEGAIFNSTLWEPGYTEVRHIKIANEGTLALKYQLNIVANGEVSDLADVIDVYYIDPAEAAITNRAQLKDENKLGTLTNVLANISTTASGNLKADEAHTITLALKMQESAGNEYQDLAIGADFSIQLLATQLTSEIDSFDDQYDAEADYTASVGTADELATALRAGGKIQITKDIILEEVLKVGAGVIASIDLNGKKITAGNDGYVVRNQDGGTLVIGDTLDSGTVEGIVHTGPESKTIVNAGTYNAVDGGAYVFLNSKGSLTINKATINGGSSYPLYSYNDGHELIVNDATVNGTFGCICAYSAGNIVVNDGEFYMTGVQGITSHIAYIYGSTTMTINGGTFKQIGDINMSGTGGGGIGSAGTAVITINDGVFEGDYRDLYVWSTTSKIIVKGGTYAFSPTSEGAKIAEGYVAIANDNGTYTVIKGTAASTQTALDTAIESGESTVVLGSGEYVIPDSAMGKTLTIIGNGSTTVAVQDDGGAEGDIDYSLRGSNVTFENVTLNIKGSSYPGYAGLSAVYNDCTIVGSNYTLYGDSVFNNCTFNLNNGYVWTWGAENVEFNGCTFEDTVGGKAKAILVHNTVETVVTVKDCTFKATTAASTWDGIPVAAVSIDPENGSPDATVHFEGTNTYSDAFYSLYQVKYADEVDDVTITVDGTEVAVTAMK